MLKDHYGKIALTTLVTILVGLSVSYLKAYGTYTTRQEVSVMIEKESPYNEDRKLIRYNLERLYQGQQRQDTKMDKILEKLN